MTDQEHRDQEHLKLLSIFHYVLGGLVALIACIPLVHLALGIFLLVAPEQMTTESGEMPPPFFGWFFVIFASFFILGGWALALLIAIAGRSLAKRMRRTFCTVIAGIECLLFPMGTVLGVFTIIVLQRESVAPLFDGAPSRGDFR